MGQHAARSRYFRLNLEILEDRTVPAVTLGFGAGAFEITDIDATPDYTWASPDTAGPNTVPQNDTLFTTLQTTVGFTREDLGLVNLPGGSPFTLSLYWLEHDNDVNETVVSRNATKTFTASGTTVTYATGWGSLWQWIAPFEGLPNAEFFVRVWRQGGWSWDYVSTSHIWLQNGGTTAGGAARPARAPTAGITYGPVAAANLNLPLSTGQTYLVYTFESTDGANMKITGANNTGHSLLNASSDQIVFNGQSAAFAQGTTFQTVYANGSNQIGQWSGSSKIIGALSNEIAISGYSYTAAPSGLPGNGQTVTRHVSQISAGDDALWIVLHADEDLSVGFLIVADTEPPPPPPPPPGSAVSMEMELVSQSAATSSADSSGADFWSVANVFATFGTGLGLSPFFMTFSDTSSNLLQSRANPPANQGSVEALSGGISSSDEVAAATAEVVGNELLFAFIGRGDDNAPTPLLERLSVIESWLSNLP